MLNKKFSYSKYLQAHYHETECCMPVTFPQSSIYQGREGAGFFELMYIGKRRNENRDRSRGWKIHISIDDNFQTDPKKINLKRAWDLIADIMIEHKIQQCKVVTPEGNFSNGHVGNDHDNPDKQYGKQITLYCFLDPREYEIDFWASVLQQIESTLFTHGIKPDPTPTQHQEAVIEGSRYFTYRNDAQIATRYLYYAYTLAYLKTVDDSERQNYTIFQKLKFDEVSIFGLPDVSINAEVTVQNIAHELFQVELGENDGVLALCNLLNSLEPENSLLKILQEICDCPHMCYGKRSYTDNMYPFPAPFLSIVINPTLKVPRNFSLTEQLFGRKKTTDSEHEVVNNALHTA